MAWRWSALRFSQAWKSAWSLADTSPASNRATQAAASASSAAISGKARILPLSFIGALLYHPGFDKWCRRPIALIQGATVLAHIGLAPHQAQRDMILDGSHRDVEPGSDFLL